MVAIIIMKKHVRCCHVVTLKKCAMLSRKFRTNKKNAPRPGAVEKSLTVGKYFLESKQILKSLTIVNMSCKRDRWIFISMVFAGE